MITRVFNVIKLVVLIFIFLLPTQIPSSYAENDRAAPVMLIVYAYDRCGGCGADGPGCGECKDLERLHNIVKKQLGERLYGGAIVYRMFNTRIRAVENECVSKGETYGVPDEFRKIRPITFIGREDGGLYLPGEPLMQFIGHALDRFLAGDDLEHVQSDLIKIMP